MNYGQYDCSLEELSSRNRSILIWLSIGVVWFFLNTAVFNIQWFWQEFYTAATESGWQVDTNDCEITVYDRCERYVSTGGIWWALLATLLSGISVGPLVFAGIIFTYRTKDVTHEWKEKIWTLLFFINPSMIWALLWLICLPFTWGLLPWGEWSTNWWKIFPFGFGLAWLALLPPFFCLLEFFKTLFNPEYTLDQKTEQIAETESEENEKSNSTNTPAIIRSKSTYKSSEGIDFSFTAPKLPDNAWIGIVPVEIPHGDEAVNDSHDTSFEYLGGRTKGDITLPNPGLGTWTLRLHDTDNNGRELAHAVFEVTSSHASSETLSSGRTCEIHILEATVGKPIRFNVNNRPSTNDAWVGIYPAGATDQDHGEQNKRWKWLREIDVNDATLPPQAEGNWSIRVFSDGGFNQIGRLDFDITEVHDSTSFSQPHHARRGNSEISDEEAIRLYKKALDDHGVPSDFLAETQTSRGQPARGQPASNSDKKIQSAVKESSDEGNTNFWDSIE